MTSDEEPVRFLRVEAGVARLAEGRGERRRAGRGPGEWTVPEGALTPSVVLEEQNRTRVPELVPIVIGG